MCEPCSGDWWSGQLFISSLHLSDLFTDHLQTEEQRIMSKNIPTFISSDYVCLYVCVCVDDSSWFMCACLFAFHIVPKAYYVHIMLRNAWLCVICVYLHLIQNYVIWIMCEHLLFTVCTWARIFVTFFLSDWCVAWFIWYSQCESVWPVHCVWKCLVLVDYLRAVQRDWFTTVTCLCHPMCCLMR